MADDNNKGKRDVTADLICPITLELPFDPVTAEDGRFYEREAIEKHFESAGQIKSPYTNEVMGKRLFAAPQLRNTIEVLIDNGVITGDLADIWAQRVEAKKRIEELLEQAEQGDVVAMETVGTMYYYGSGRFKQDDKMAFKWFKKAHDAGHMRATAALGEMYCHGFAVARNWNQGTTYLGMAAKESALAAFRLGKAFAKGRYGLEIDKAEACRLLEHAVNGEQDDVQEDAVEEARTMLAELKQT